MKISTASWFSTLPAETVRIGISRGVPMKFKAGKLLLDLAPGWWFREVSANEYDRRYRAQLDRLDAAQIVRQLHELGQGQDCALVCFERVDRPGDWCHRAHVSEWMHDRLGIEVRELGYEDRGFGRDHPLLWRPDLFGG